GAGQPQNSQSPDAAHPLLPSKLTCPGRAATPIALRPTPSMRAPCQTVLAVEFADFVELNLRRVMRRVVTSGIETAASRQILPGRLRRVNHKRAKVVPAPRGIRPCASTDRTAPRWGCRLRAPSGPPRPASR